MNESPLSVEERIIQAAIECIEQFGVQGTTNRKIAQMAGVNSAAINYYFRSKEKLIQRCMEVTLENAFDFSDYESLPGGSAQERCVAIFDDLIRGGLQYPGLTRSHFYDVITSGRYDGLAVQKLNEFVAELVQDMRARGVPLDEDLLPLSCMQISASVMMMILAPGLFQEHFGLDLAQAQTRKQFLERLVGQLLR